MTARLCCANGIALLRSCAVPLHGLAVVLRDAQTVFVHVTEAVFGSGIAPRGSLSNPVHGLTAVLGDASTVLVHQT